MVCIGKDSGQQVVMTLSKYFNEDEFLVKEGWVCWGIVIEVVADVIWR